jgi:HSP20 family protein
LTIETHLPNFKQEEISVQEHQGALEIKAEHKESEENKKKGRKYMVRESVNQYYRRFALPNNADIINIKANFEDGILKVNVPFKALPQPKKIAIKAKISGNK